jgi:hypothetical protein
LEVIQFAGASDHAQIRMKELVRLGGIRQQYPIRAKVIGVARILDPSQSGKALPGPAYRKVLVELKAEIPSGKILGVLFVKGKIIRSGIPKTSGFEAVIPEKRFLLLCLQGGEAQEKQSG